MAHFHSAHPPIATRMIYRTFEVIPGGWSAVSELFQICEIGSPLNVTTEVHIMECFRGRTLSFSPRLWSELAIYCKTLWACANKAFRHVQIIRLHDAAGSGIDAHIGLLRQKTHPRDLG